VTALTRVDLPEGVLERTQAVADARDLIAADLGVNRSEVFDDRTLERIVAAMPSSREELAGVVGVSPQIAEDYGDWLVRPFIEMETDRSAVLDFSLF
jgi:ribonuclease D